MYDNLSDAFFLYKKIPITEYLTYLIGSTLLYGSLYWLSLYASFKSLIGIKAKIIVTPKEDCSYTIGEIIKGNIREYIFSFSLIGISLVFTGSLLPLILILLPEFSTLWLTILSGKENRVDNIVND